MRQCPKCRAEKALDEFDRDRSRADGLHPYCKQCRKGYHTANREQALARMVLHNLANRDANRDRRYQSRYGVTAAEVDDLRTAQGYRCVICGRHEDELPRGLFVDHDHVTELVRGLLCQSCNSGIGHFADDPVLLSAAIKYLQMADELRAIAENESH
ncbi:MAG: endonuclease VII domain-containing protein [Umezawaea sp.]